MEGSWRGESGDYWSWGIGMLCAFRWVYLPFVIPYSTCNDECRYVGHFSPVLRQRCAFGVFDPQLAISH